MNKIPTTDDEPTIRMPLSRMLELEGYEVLKARDRATTMHTLKNNGVQVALCDVFLSSGNGMDMVQELQLLAPKAKMTLLTANGNISDGMQAIKNGVLDYIIKGGDNRKIIPIMSRAIDVTMSENKKKKPSATAARSHTFDIIVGKSAVISDALQQAQKVATTDVTVPINGETGTSKEVFAQATHNASHRSNEVSLAFNCSALSRELLENELFGYRAGVFTGVTKDKKGSLEEVNHGTVFFDEIGEMVLELQSKLLRVLEIGEFVKVGDAKTTYVDVRILSATNRNLKEEIANGRLRGDLCFRLSVFRIELPPSRPCKGDILPPAQHFIERYVK